MLTADAFSPWVYFYVFNKAYEKTSVQAVSFISTHKPIYSERNTQSFCSILIYHVLLNQNETTGKYFNVLKETGGRFSD